LNLLYWNLHNNNLKDCISEVFFEKDIDIAVFSEYKNTEFAVDSDYTIIPSMGGTDRIILLCKSSIKSVLLKEQSRYAFYQILYKGKKIILSGVHLQDEFYSHSAVRKQTIGELISDLEEIRGNIETRIIIGDFNANPFSEELLQYNCFNSVLFQEVIKSQKKRIVENKEYERFYNPILNYISEDNKMYGSYYHTSDPATTVWHCIDQIIVSADLVDSIGRVSYLRSIGEKSLIKTRRPNSEIYSDHLPLFVEMNMGEIK